MSFRPPCKSVNKDYLHWARDMCNEVGHLGDPSMPNDEFDDWLMSVNSGDPKSGSGAGDSAGDSGGGGSGSLSQTCPFVDVFLYMLLKARQAAAAMALIMLSAMVIVLRSAQFISGRWAPTFGANCTISGMKNFFIPAAILCILNVLVLFFVYWPAYLAFLSITSVMAWVITAIKATILSILVYLQ